MKAVGVLLAVVLLAACAPPHAGPTTPSSTTSSAVPPTSPPASASSQTAPASASPSTSATWTLSTDGLGPLVLGTPYATVLRLGYVVADPSGDCRPWTVSPGLETNGVSVDFSGSDFMGTLYEVTIRTSKYATVSGARVGMTLRQVRDIYTTRMAVESKMGDGGAFQVASVRVGAKELVFLFPWDDGAVDTALVTSITTRPWSMEMHGGC